MRTLVKVDKLQARISELEAEVERLRAALGSTEADLALLRFRADARIGWGEGGVPQRWEVDQTIGKARKTLGYS
jgi:hypothetical protein